MLDRLTLPALVLLAAGMIALAMVWPQGQGAQSPAPFGHPLEPVETSVIVNGQPVTGLRGAENLDARSAIATHRSKHKPAH